ncbi:dihydroxyacetone kinase [Moniliophthora roreri MCA 2997]|uniref:Dihydroxyacetone kinase n=2 Tax=Moniliophthora roreri TaxID=221103 RepID=V2XYB5_MONRO|nr:dihydroxyacetone kinase [Moniliophthora roreri MCA 2997]KAI3602634.1 dihydroxyacetone kinase [Moniliophthora roreri]
MSTIQNKHFLNKPENLVLDSLEGLCTLNPALALDRQNKTVYISQHDKSKVALICGGGSGHEPAHAGFVGNGILTAAVCGNVFASPNASQVRRGIDLVHNDKGTVIIVKNYTGDVLNFGLAKEQYAALHPEYADRVKFVIVGDDVAVGKTQGSIVGRRGLAGTVLVYKIAGALARRGASLDEVYNTAQWVASRVATIGVGLEHCHVPGTAPSATHLSASEIEIGMGIHNESGNKRISPLPPLSELIPQLLDLLSSTSDPERSFVPFKGPGKDKVVLLINNLGGVSELELGAIVAETKRQLGQRNISIERVLSGSFMTSLNMPGFSITLLLLPDSASDPSTSLILSLLDEKTDAPGWKWSSGTPVQSLQEVSASSTTSAAIGSKGEAVAVPNPEQFIASIKKACEALVKEEPEITRMDNIAGDGDCGLTLKAGAQGVLSKIDSGSITGKDVVGSIIAISQVAEEAMGGTSGALYSIFFSALAQGLTTEASSSSTYTPQIWTGALKSALEKLYSYTRARPPSRTLVDPLAAFVENADSLPQAVKAAAVAAEHTKDIEAKAGRSAYVEGDRLKEQKVPDPGAWGVKTVLENLNLV